MKLIWHFTAEQNFYQQIKWYKAYKGLDFATTFRNNVSDTISLITSMPSIGRLEKVYKTKTLRSIFTHPRCRIYYKHDDKTIEITRLYFNSKQNG